MYNSMCISEAKAKTLISRAATVQLICAFVFIYAKCRFSHDVAQIEYCMHAHVLIVEFNKLVAEKNIRCLAIVTFHFIVFFSSTDLIN